MEKIDFTLGADPEFNLYTLNHRSEDKYGRLIPAYDCMYRGAGAGTGSMDHLFTKHGSVGKDGNDVSFELRPKPDVDPRKVVKNLTLTFTQVFKNRFVDLENKIISVESRKRSYYPLGGHVHFGFMDKPQQKQARKFFPSSCDLAPYTDGCRIADKVSNLDYFLGVPSVLLSGESGFLSRGPSYGFFGDIRHNAHGIEYRTPSCWLSSPFIALAFLSLSKVVMYDILNKPYSNKKPYVILMAKQLKLRRMKQTQIAFSSMRDRFSKDIWPQIQQMELYPKYQNEVNVLQTLISNNKTWYPKRLESVAESWGLIK